MKSFFNTFLQHHDVQRLLPLPQQPGNVWTRDPHSSRELYELWATHLRDEHPNPQAGNGRLGVEQVLSYLNKMLHLGKSKHREKGGAEAMLFFSCVDTKSTSAQAQWLFGLRKNLKIGKCDGYAADDSSIKVPLP